MSGLPGPGHLSLLLGDGLFVDEVSGELGVDSSTISSVGTLTSGSIAPGFGDIDIGENSLRAGVVAVASSLVFGSETGSVSVEFDSSQMTEHGKKSN